MFPHPIIPTSESCARGRCVVVDDDPNFLALAQYAIHRTRHGLDVVRFHDAPSALEFIAREHADVVVTDVRMPMMDGLQLTAAIRALHPSLPIVVMSSEDRTREAMASGANRFLAKNLLMTHLGAVLNELLIADDAEIAAATSA